MANGFLEPLDAPGLTLTIDVLEQLITILSHQLNFREHTKEYSIERANSIIEYQYQFWASFILLQYKTSIRNDTQFWIDHKNVNYDFYENIIKNYYTQALNELHGNVDMIFFTTAAKDVQWDLPYKRQPFKLPTYRAKSIHHLDYIEQFH